MCQDGCRADIQSPTRRHFEALMEQFDGSSAERAKSAILQILRSAGVRQTEVAQAFGRHKGTICRGLQKAGRLRGDQPPRDLAGAVARDPDED